MAGLEKRIESLEGRVGLDEDLEAREKRTEAMRAEILVKLARVIDQEGIVPRRRAALEDLQEFVERRRHGA